MFFIYSRFCRHLLPLLALTAFLLAPHQARAIETAAKEAFLVDFETGAVLLEKNADTPMPPSSMSKMMTIFMVFEQLRDSSLSLDDQLPVSVKAWRKGGSKMFVREGDNVTVEDLINGVIVHSGNDACIVIAEGLAGSEEAFSSSGAIGESASIEAAAGKPGISYVTSAIGSPANWVLRTAISRIPPAGPIPNM